MANDNHDSHAASTGLPAGWVWTTIGEITQPIEKVDPTRKPEAEFTYLDISSIDNKSNVIRDPKTYYGTDAPSRARQLVRGGDVLFSTVRTYLKNIAEVPEAYDGQIASTGFSVLRGIDGIASKYLFYYSLTTDFLSALAELQRGTSYPAVRDSDVREQPIPLAPTAEQHRIVAKIEEQFTRLDAGVAALKRTQANLKRYKAAVLKAACEGKLVEQDPSDEPASELLKRIFAERPPSKARGKGDSRTPALVTAGASVAPTDDLPELPSWWCWASVEQVCDRIVDCLHSTAKFQESGFFCVDSNCIKPGQIVLERVRYVDEPTFIERNRRMKPQEDDVIFSREGALLGIAVRVPAGIEFCLGQRMMIFRLSECIDARYYENVLNSSVFRAQYIGKVTGTASPHLNIEDTRQLAIPLPPLAEQRRIVAEVERRLSVVQELEATLTANLARAERLRQSILKRAFEGKL